MQWLAHLFGKQKVPGSNPGGAAWHFSNLACKVYVQECKSKTRGLKPYEIYNTESQFPSIQ